MAIHETRAFEHYRCRAGAGGAVLASGTHGYLAQETFFITTSGEYVLVLDNRSSPSSRTVKLTVSVKGR